MANMYDMGAVASVQVVEKNHLKCGIHNVIFTGVEKADYQGIDGTGAIIFTFDAVDGSGTHKELLFEAKSCDRVTIEKNGIEKVLPSQVEQFMAKIKQIITALNPEASKSIESGEKKFSATSFEGLIKLLKKIIDPAIGTKTQIKLVPNKKGFAAFPVYPANLSKEGIIFMGTRFIGETLTLSSYEVTEINKLNNAAPTNMNNSSDDATLAAMQADFNTSSTDIDDDLPF